MKELLFLSHRIPYPPNKGDKIRSYHLLKHLTRSYRVHLGTFIDDPADWKYADEVRRMCGDTCLLPLTPWQAKLRCLSGLLTGEALTVPYYRNPAMQDWVSRQLSQRSPQGVLVFSSAMAQYVEHLDELIRVIDFVDVDSDKWSQYAERKGFPGSWIYRRESLRLLDFERRIADRFDHSLFVSEEEAALFRRLAPESTDKIGALENGVDTEYFNDSGDYSNPYSEGKKIVVFTGAMDYWANVDAVVWFAREVFSEIRQRCQDVCFYVVGSRPSQAVLELSEQPGIVVTGAVADIRPYLAHARLVVAPLRIARGIQNKVLEAMAMGKPLLASAQAMEGIELSGPLDFHVPATPPSWIQQVLDVLDQDALPAHSERNRLFVCGRYGWERNLRPLDSLWQKP